MENTVKIDENLLRQSASSMPLLPNLHQQHHHHPFPPTSMHFPKRSVTAQQQPPSLIQSPQQQQQMASNNNNGMMMERGGGGDGGDYLNKGGATMNNNNFQRGSTGGSGSPGGPVGPVGNGGGHHHHKQPGASKVYIGHLSSEVTKDNLIDFLMDVGKIPEQLITKVNVKTGFAFVEFLGYGTADEIVSLCNGKPFMNTVVRVEKAVNSEQYNNKMKGKLIQVLIDNCNELMTRDELRDLLDEAKVHFVNMEEVRGRLIGSKSFVVRVSSMRMAQKIVDEWGNKIINGNRLQMRILEESFGDGAGDSSSSLYQLPGGGGGYANTEGYVDVRSLDIPLRILVPNDFIGAIIGRGGSTIRTISKATGARLDIFRHVNRNYDMPEKPVSISGAKEKASEACRKVLEIIAQEADHVKGNVNKEKPVAHDICLKIFVPNAVVGRVIGKNGTVIKNLMEETQTKIHIANQPEFMEDGNYMNRRNSQRLITVRGSIDGMCQAEMIISEKIREAFAEGKVRERDLEFGANLGQRPGILGGGGVTVGQMMNSFNSGHSGQFGGGHSPNPYIPPTLSPTEKFRSYERRFDFGMRYTSPGGGSYPMSSMDPNHEGVMLSRPETGYMYVPDEIVGALIGRKGESIREIIHASGASIKIMEGIVYINTIATRRVVIHGGAQSIFYAQALIYEKVMRDWGGANDNGQELTVEMTVPTEFVGRMIGKGGANVRDIQRQYYCKIKYMTEPDTCIPPPNEGETYVRICGNADSFVNAQKKIRAVLSKIVTLTRSFPHNSRMNRSLNDSSINEGRLNPTEEINYSQSDDSQQDTTL